MLTTQQWLLGFPEHFFLCLNIIFLKNITILSVELKDFSQSEHTY